MDWLDPLAVQGTLKSLLQHQSSKASILRRSAFFTVQLSHPYMTTGKTIVLTRRCFLGISNFPKEISSVSHSIVFLYFFALITEEDFLISLAILWNSAFKWVYLSFFPLPFTSLLFAAICKASSHNDLAFLYFFFLGMVLITASYTVSWTSIHSSSGILAYQI